jgi:hypothetical protein
MDTFILNVVRCFSNKTIITSNSKWIVILDFNINFISCALQCNTGFA